MSIFSRRTTAAAALGGALLAAAALPASAQQVEIAAIGTPSAAAEMAINLISDPCVEFVYDTLCVLEMEKAVKAALGQEPAGATPWSETDQQILFAVIRGYAVKYAGLRGLTNEMLTKYSIPTEGQYIRAN